jgi:hypothetical protein
MVVNATVSQSGYVPDQGRSLQSGFGQVPLRHQYLRSSLTNIPMHRIWAGFSLSEPSVR